MANLDYELRSDGVQYELSGGFRVRVKGKSAKRVSVTIQHGNTIVPPETGNLESSTFRERLTNLARERVGEVEGLIDDLGLVAVALDEHLGERKKAALENGEAPSEPALAGTQYRIIDGGFVRMVGGDEVEIAHRLSNFVARVEEEAIRDDGAEPQRNYVLSGSIGERKLHRVEVPASRFPGMGWLPERWGVSARLAGGASAKEYVREAIQLLSEGAPTRYVYTHTGWRRLADGELVYLHAGLGAGSADHVEVELEAQLASYAFPELPDDEACVREALRASMALLRLAPARATAPLLGVAYLAPLTALANPDFVVWVWGGTGSYKSTLSALFLCHYGTFSEDKLPLSFESTANALERYLFLLKDVLVVVDDFRPPVSRGDASEMDRKAQRVLRSVGNRQGRGRMHPDTRLRHPYPPRGMVVATAESLPEGPAFASATARSFSLHLDREDVDLPVLGDLQGRRGELAVAMASHVRWLAPRYEALANWLPGRLETLRRELRGRLPGSHPRTPDAAAALIVGLATLRAHAVEAGVDRSEADDFLAEAREGVIEAAAAHVEATMGADPAARFMDLQRSLFAAGRVYVRHRETGSQPPGWRYLGWEENDALAGEPYRPKRGADFVGWADEEYVYLDKELAYAAVAGFAQRGEIPFGVKPLFLWRELKRAGVSLTNPGRTDAVARIEGETKRVLQIRRDILSGEYGR